MNHLERQVAGLSALQAHNAFGDYVTRLLTNLLTRNPELLNRFAAEVLQIKSDEDLVVMPNRCFTGAGDKNRVFADIALVNSEVCCVIRNCLADEASDEEQAAAKLTTELNHFAAALEAEKQQQKNTYLRLFTNRERSLGLKAHQFLQVQWKTIYLFFRRNGEFASHAQEFLEFLENFNLSDIAFNANDLERMSKNINLFNRLGHLMEDTRVKYGFGLEELKNVHDYRHHRRLVYLKNAFDDQQGKADYGFGLLFREEPALYVWLWVDKAHAFYNTFNDMLQQPKGCIAEEMIHRDSQSGALAIRWMATISEDKAMLSFANKWYSEKLDQVLEFIHMLKKESVATA